MCIGLSRGVVYSVLVYTIVPSGNVCTHTSQRVACVRNAGLTRNGIHRQFIYKGDTSTHTHRELIREWLWEPTGSSHSHGVSSSHTSQRVAFVGDAVLGDDEREGGETVVEVHQHVIQALDRQKR